MMERILMLQDPRVCPKCGKQTGYVIDTRLRKNGGLMRRRRCAICFHTWGSVEMYYDTLETLLIDKLESEEHDVGQ